MHIEVVAIGSELLVGSTINTNAADIGRALFQAGYRVDRQSTLPDEAAALKAGLEECLQRSRLVICTGGLGPTCDDITRQTAAALFNSPFRFDAAIAAELKKRYGNALISLEDQATVPVKAAILPNAVGTAPGLVFESPTATLVLMPGIPREMRVMLHEQLIPHLKTHFAPPVPKACRAAHFFSLSESAVDPLIRQLHERFPAVDFGIYPSYGIMSIYATVDQDKSTQLQALEELSAHFAAHHFESPTGKVEEAVWQLFTQKGWTLSTAESCTGGGIAARLTQVPGASAYFLGGIVSYDNALKKKLLNVPESQLTAHGAVSEEVVSAMAQGAIAATGSDVAIAVSGVAGPSGGTAEKPVGTVWLAIAKKGQPPHAWKLQARGNRGMIIEWSINTALGKLLHYCSSLNP